MSVYYLDTSAAVKRYVDETGSDWIRNLIDAEPPHLLVSSRLLQIEIISALARRFREKSITPSEFAESRTAFDEDCKLDYQLLGITAEIVTLACRLVERHPLRSYDAIHLAIALNVAQFFLDTGLPPPIFLTADERLIPIAQAEGLATGNPNHPA